MPLTLREALLLPPLAGSRVLAGHAGLDRPLLSINVMDAPDIADWSTPGQLILTTGFALPPDVERARDVLAALARRGAAGFGLKVRRFWQEVPPELLSWANGVGFPLLALPHAPSFADMIAAILPFILHPAPPLEEVARPEDLLRSVDPAVLHRYYRATFAPLLSRGPQGEEILATLAAYLRSNRRLRETARQLYVHRNTVLYRLQKAEEILGVSLDDAACVLRLQLAIVAGELLQAGSPPPPREGLGGLG